MTALAAPAPGTANTGPAAGRRATVTSAPGGARPGQHAAHALQVCVVSCGAGSAPAGATLSAAADAASGS